MNSIFPGMSGVFQGMNDVFRGIDGTFLGMAGRDTQIQVINSPRLHEKIGSMKKSCKFAKIFCLCRSQLSYTILVRLRM